MHKKHFSTCKNFEIKVLTRIKTVLLVQPIMRCLWHSNEGGLMIVKEPRFCHFFIDNSLRNFRMRSKKEHVFLIEYKFQLELTTLMKTSLTWLIINLSRLKNQGLCTSHPYLAKNWTRRCSSSGPVGGSKRSKILKFNQIWIETVRKNNQPFDAAGFHGCRF